MASLPLFPKLEPEMDKKIGALCQDADASLVAQLILDVQQHVVDVRQALRVNEFLDVSTAEKIAVVLVKILGKMENYSQEQKRLIVGAARYFVQSNDAQADLNSVLGFDDDAEVLNYVLAALGHNDMRIKL